MKHLIILFAFFYSYLSYAFTINKVELVCSGPRCEKLEKLSRGFKTTFIDNNHFYLTLDLFVSNNGLKKVEYELKDDLLILKVKPKYVVDQIKIQSNSKYKIIHPENLPVLFGDYWDGVNNEKIKIFLKEYYDSLGFPEVKLKFNEKFDKDYVSVFIDVEIVKAILVKDLNIRTTSPIIKEMLDRKIQKFKGEPYYQQALRDELEDFIKLMKDYGYYGITLDSEVKNNKEGVKIDFKIDVGPQFAFEIEENDLLTNKEIKNELKTVAILYKNNLTKEAVAGKVLTLLKNKGISKPEAFVSESIHKNIWDQDLKIFKIKINYENRKKIKKIFFRGSSFFSDSDIYKLFYEEASGAVQNNLIDLVYLDHFPNVLQKKYYENGYVLASVSKPIIRDDSEVDGFYVEYKIKENLPSVVNSIDIKGISDNSLKDEILDILNLKIHKSFNPIDLPQKIQKIEEFLLSQGYFYSKILNPKDIIRYDDEATKVNVFFNFDLGPKIRVNSIYVFGTTKTRLRLIRREIGFHKGDILTPKNIKKANNNLLSLGLFSSIKINPERISSDLADLYIIVKEKEPGSLEIAPGFRTDLGFKLSGTLTYNNLEGMNKVISIKGQVNERFSYDSFDEKRKKDKKSFMEYELGVNYYENHIFNSEYDFTNSISQSKKRFYSFDAEISRMNTTVSRDFTDVFSSSLKFQLETIRQSNATNIDDDGEFQIGSLTPSIAFDFRDSRINPTKGAYFNISNEIANPTFFSQDKEDLTINYYKATSRNKFYYPIPYGVFATSLTMGMQENLAKKRKNDGTLEGYIPNIKVFRLSGIDAVRGFEDEEINRLVNGKDISEITVENKAYLVNLKVEPRFFLNDFMMLGVFYDAGRIYVQDYDLSKLRSSVGLSFKFLTPVGSLDIDYGIKLLRKRDIDGNLETPGRLHVSIGFF